MKKTIFAVISFLLGGIILSSSIAYAVGAFPVATGGTGQVSFPAGLIASTGGTNPLISTSSPTVGYIWATSTTATSTFANGILITKGCFSVNGTCITGAGSTENLFQVLTQGNDGGGLNIADVGSVTGTTIAATSTTGTSTITNALQIGLASTQTNFLTVTPSKTVGASISTGGAINLTNTNNDGAGLVLFTNDGATANGRLLEVNCQNVAFAQDCEHIDFTAPGAGLSITYAGVTGGAAESISTVTSTTTVFNVSCTASSQGCEKITHVGTTTDSNAAGLSIDNATSTVAANGTTGAQILFLNSTGSTTGNIITGRNKNIDFFTVNSTGWTGISSSTPGSPFGITGILNLTAATSTWYSTGGINLTSGCFAVGGNCVGSGGSGTVTSITGGTGLFGGTITTSGTLALRSYVATSSVETANQVPFWTSTSGTPANLSGGSANFVWNNTNSVLTVTGASTTNATVATFLGIPNSASQTPAITGQLAFDTTNDQIKVGDSGASPTTAVFDQRRFLTFTYSTTTAWTGTTTLSLGTTPAAVTFQNVQCYTDVGTLNVDYFYGPAPTHLALLNASTSVGTFNWTTNNTPGSGATSTVSVGTPASSPSSISCTVTAIVSGT